MPIQRRFDYQVAGKGFMLQRGEFKGRAWHRTGRSDAPGQRSQESAKFGAIPDELDHPEVWNDWSGGAFKPYREVGADTYHWSENFDARFPRQLIHCQAPRAYSSPTATYIVPDIQQIVVVPPNATATVYGGRYRVPYIFMAGGWGWAKLSPSSGTVFDESGTGGSGAKSQYELGRIIVTGTALFLPRLTASGDPKLHRLDLPTLTLATTYDLPYRQMVTSGDRTWIAIGGSANIRAVVQSISGDPVATANLTASLPVGDDLAGINDMAVLEDQLCVGKSNGLYIGDRTGTFTNITPWLSQASNNENFRDLMPWAGGILGQTVQALWFYQQSGFTAEMKEVAVPGGRSPIQGYVRALGNSGPWVYVGKWTGSGSYLLATRDIPSSNPRWHPLQSFPAHCISRIAFDGITTASGIATAHIPQRAWVAMSADFAGTYPPYYWPVPDVDENPLAPQTVFSPNYIGSARMDMGAVDWGSPGTSKIMRAVEVWSDKLASAAQWCQVHYDIDQSGSFTLLGTVAKSPKDVLYFPSGEGSFITGQSIELSLRSFTASAATSPVYRAIVLRGALTPRSVDTITAVTRIADGLRDRQGNLMRSGATMLQELRDLANPDVNGLQAHQMIDLMGAVNYVKVLPPIDEQEVYQKGEENPEIAATVRFAVMQFS